MPIPGDVVHYWTLLFNLTEPVIMSIDKYRYVLIQYIEFAVSGWRIVFIIYGQSS